MTKKFCDRCEKPLIETELNSSERKTIEKKFEVYASISIWINSPDKIQLSKRDADLCFQCRNDLLNILAREIWNRTQPKAPKKT